MIQMEQKSEPVDSCEAEETGNLLMAGYSSLILSLLKFSWTEFGLRNSFLHVW